MKDQVINRLFILIVLIVIVISCNTEEHEWVKANEENSIEGFGKFIQKYPEGTYLVEAKTKVEHLKWEQAKSANTLSAYQQFLLEYPSEEFSDSASRAIINIEYDQVKGSSNRDKLEHFVDKYPTSDKVTEIIEEINMIDFNNTVLKDNPKMLFQFVENNPAFIQMISKKDWKKLASLGHVSYSYKTFWLVSVQDQETGNWVYPTYRIHYRDGFSGKTIKASVSGTTYKCPLLYQDIAFYKEDTKVPVFAYQRCPFSVRESLSVDKDMKFELPLTITIDSISNNVMWVSQSSAFPFIYNNGNLLSGYNSAINVTWLFLKKGELFFAGNEAYFTLKDSARIRFAKKDIVIDGLKKYLLNN